MSSSPVRKTTQHLIPVTHEATTLGTYDIYPGHPLGSGKISIGYDALARRISGESTIILDGYVGIDWEAVRESLCAAFESLGVSASWQNVAQALRPEEEIDELVAPFLGGNDPIFGTRFTGKLADFFDGGKLRALQRDPKCQLNIVYGCGAALSRWQGFNVYVDLPKNELQFRSRAGKVCNLGKTSSDDAKSQYKRFYFVDWVVLNAHKKELASSMNLVVDGQRHDHPLFSEGEEITNALRRLAASVFRVRPWFEPGPWGGQWIREKIPGLSPNVPNYAWSFEMIVPENGLLFESDGALLEVSFDFIMFVTGGDVLGDFADRFGDEFPVRFDFLDTFDGGNLSLQCHPRPDYIRRHFGENFTQDETYYILDCKPGAEVFLGFREDIDPPLFERELRRSFADSTPLDVRRFVNVEAAQKHDLFLIPSGTIHCSGIDNMVLEISATPYIFTFKMYDWQRLDLEGLPRPLNIDRAMANVYFDRKGDRVRREFISRPVLLEEGEGHQVFHLPTHAEHFYDIHRFD
ncbi:MAG: class I mannose-6-phosphate isomerase, partial [Candidatus Sumerlaeota bacterium]